MKNWQETESLFRRVAQGMDAGHRCAVGTVVSIAGSAYRRPGAKLLVRRDGRAWGGVSGGCLEADVREVALEVLDRGEPVLRSYRTGSDENVVWGLGLGCDGSVEILVQPYPPTGDGLFIDRALGLLGGRKPFSIVTVLPGSGPSPAGAAALVDSSGAVASGTGDGSLDARLASVAMPALASASAACVEDAGLAAFVDVLLPPPEALICGAGDDAMPLAAVAAQAGFRVAVSDHRPAYLTAERFPGAALIDPGDLPPGRVRDSYAVVMTHDLERDRAWLRALADGGAAYIGLLGPRARRDDLLDGVPADALPTIYGPVGLDIGADGPEQVALSVVAEMLAAGAGREPGHLRDREAPIHARTEVVR